MAYFTKTILAASLIGLSGLAACQTYEKATHPIMQVEMTKITGEISYRERIALLPGATAHVKLLNVSKQDAPSITVTEERIDLDGRSVPVAFDVSTASLRLDPNERYAVRAEIRSADGKLMFTTDRTYSVDPKEPIQDLGMLLLKKV